jgi:hypothetical protein
MDGNWRKYGGRGMGACRVLSGDARIDPQTMLGLVAMRAAWPWFSIVTASLYLVPAADAMMRQNRDIDVRDPLD